VLVAPDPEALIRQNDPASGCAFHAAAGYGSRIVFDWGDVTAAAGLARYEIHVQHEGSAGALVDTIASSSEYVYLGCGGYVVERNLRDWVWKVRAVDRDGRASDWVERRFAFAPCRLDDGLCGG
jgi:hypothetical protein